MTASTAIKLSPAMVTALKGAVVVGDSVFVPSDTKTQTTKGLESRGLSTGSLLTPEGVEAARQLGAEVHVPAPESAATAPVVSEDAPLAQWEIDALNGSDSLTDDVQIDQQHEEINRLSAILEGPELKKITDLDKRVVVPNREDRRKVRGIRAALSRMGERRRARKVAKYGQTNYKGEVLAA